MQETSSGELSDFESLYRREIRALVAVALAMCGQRSLAEEIAQEAMLRVYRDWASVSRMDRPGAWARRVVINLAIDDRRRTTRERMALRRIGPLTADPPTSVANDAFWTAVRALPDRQRSAVVLRYVEDLPVEDVARILQIEVGTAKSTLFAARRTLAGVLSAEEGDDGND